MVYSTFRLCKINIKSVTEMRNIIRMVGIGVAALCYGNSYSSGTSKTKCQ